MAQAISVRGLTRSRNVRVRSYDPTDQTYAYVTLTPTTDVVVDVDDAETRKSLAKHATIGGGFVVTGTDILIGAAVGPKQLT